ncbi:MAG: hypothetical protein WBB07_17605 [Mycobacterium sp.]
MGYYNVVKPCVVGKLHYARPTAQPIQVDDEVASPLVEDGSLETYPSATERLDRDPEVKAQLEQVAEIDLDSAVAVEVDPTPRPRRPRKSRDED